MSDFIKNKIFDLHEFKRDKMIMWGLKHGKVGLYNDKLIEKLRTVYYGGVPASIILLADSMCNGYCYDRALLMSRAFLDDENVDVKLDYAIIDSLKLNPKYTDVDSFKHCFVELNYKDGTNYIIDTSLGLIFDKEFYNKLEHPKIFKVNDKESIIKFLKEDTEFHPEDLSNDKYALPAILPNIEFLYGRPNEIYSMLGIELLQREIKLYKDFIGYDSIVKEVEEDMKRLGFKHD